PFHPYAPPQLHTLSLHDALPISENPAAFPRDAVLIRTQGQFFTIDESLAAIGRATGASVESLFLWSYLLAMVLIWIGVVLVGSRLYPSPWLTLAFGALVAVRHHIPRTSVNSIEPYFQQRLLAFGIGLIAIAAFRRRRDWLA